MLDLLLAGRAPTGHSGLETAQGRDAKSARRRQCPTRVKDLIFLLVAAALDLNVARAPRRSPFVYAFRGGATGRLTFSVSTPTLSNCNVDDLDPDEEAPVRGC